MMRTGGKERAVAGKEREKIKERGHLKCEKCASDDEVIRVRGVHKELYGPR